MADRIERELAARLRLIAEQIKVWERRDIEDQKASGSRKLSRPAYFADLETVAAMLEGKHREICLKAEKSGRGRPVNIGNLDRDVAIVKFIDAHRKAPGGTIEKGRLAATKKFGVSEGTAKAAWTNLRHTLDPENGKILLFFERLRRRGMAKIARIRKPPKK